MGEEQKSLFEHHEFRFYSDTASDSAAVESARQETNASKGAVEIGSRVLVASELDIEAVKV